MLGGQAKLAVLFGLLFGNAAASQIKLQSPVPYAEHSMISDAIKACLIDQQLAEFIQQFSARRGIAVELSGHAPELAAGRVLKLEIVDVISTRAGMSSHYKSGAIRGELFEHGERIAGFEARRNSRGGGWAMYKNSCTVLKRVVRSLGNDVSIWLDQPQDGARLGDL